MKVFTGDRPFILLRGIFLAALSLGLTVHVWLWFDAHTPNDLIFNRSFLVLLSIACLLSLLIWTAELWHAEPSYDERGERLGNLPSGVAHRQRLRKIKL